MYHQNYFKHRARADTLSKRLFLGFIIFNGAIWLKVRTPAPVAHALSDKNSPWS